MNHIDLNFAVEKHQHLIKVSQTEQVLRMIPKESLQKVEPRLASPSKQQVAGSRQTVIAAKGSQPA